MISKLKADFQVFAADVASDEGHLDLAPPVDSLSYARILSYVEESITLAVQAHFNPQASDPTGDIKTEILNINELNQIRRVTILFVHFPGLAITNFEDQTTLNQYQCVFTILIRTVRSFGGCLRQFSCDDKAATALIVFGMNGYAHERGEGRPALNAATSILKGLQKTVLGSASIGVTTGMVFAGVIGVDKRLDGTVLGTCVNLAARIMTHPICVGQVVCDDETRNCFDIDGGDFDFDASSDITLK
ncbi:Adenylate cyclase type 10, partial [Irineochytrium annulatum]